MALRVPCKIGYPEEVSEMAYERYHPNTSPVWSRELLPLYGEYLLEFCILARAVRRWEARKIKVSSPHHVSGENRSYSSSRHTDLAQMTPGKIVPIPLSISYGL